MKKSVPILLALGLLAGCSTTEEKFEDKPVEAIYNGAMDQLQKGAYERAATQFDEVERQHPYSTWATKAQIMAAFAHYKGQKYEKALAALDSYLQLHPAHEDVPYALYLKGLCFYEQLLPTGRDQRETEEGVDTFKELVKRFPNSDYAKDGRLKLALLEDSVAGKEMEIGRFYQERKSYASAINRFNIVVSKFDRTRHVEEALHRIVECNLALGLRDQAQAAASVLGHNYPKSHWYAESFFLLEGKDVRPSTSPLRTKDDTWLDRLKNWNKGKAPAEPKPQGEPVQEAAPQKAENPKDAA